ncbi:hypothetical protein VTK56DRAFT_2477 [Thermocarpiscus australiensis]
MAPLAESLADVNSVNHGNVNGQCTPGTPWSIFLFFASNYLAHCATVKMYPGSSAFDTLVATVVALFLPCSGIIRALFSIGRHGRFRRNRNPLERAAAAGALRMVVRNQRWEPCEGDHIRPLLNSQGEMQVAGGPGEKAPLEGSPQRPSPGAPLISGIIADEDPNDPVSEDSVSPRPASFSYHASRDRQNFHGLALLPPGYSWREVPAEAKISWDQPAWEGHEEWTRGTPDVSSNYNWIQPLVAIFQAANAALTLYRSRGDQIQRYGYAAFGLTVVPYLVMSIVNLVAHIATADYPTVYMVASAEMDEARRRGGVFDGVVGRLESDMEPRNADAPLYELKHRYLDPAKPAGLVKVLERVSGSGAYPLSITITVSSISYTREISKLYVAAWTPLALHSRPLTRARAGVLSVWRVLILPLLLGGLSLAVVGALTRFNAGASTVAQRGWTMSWLVVGIVSGWWVDQQAGLFAMIVELLGIGTHKVKFLLVVMIPFFVVGLGLFFVPAIGGFIVVAGMLREYGICKSA